MTKKRIRFIVIITLIILIIVLISICSYVNRETLIGIITGRNQIFQAQENTSLMQNESNVNNIDISKWDLEKVNICYDTDNIPVPVPKGYVASEVDGEHTVNTGFVIYEGEEPVTGLPNEAVGTYSTDPNSAWVVSCTRNQWVWVPVADSSRIYERDSNTGKIKTKLWDFSDIGRTIHNSNYEPGVVNRYDDEKNFAKYNLPGMTRDNFLQELEKELEATIESIEKYGGFYIGRYETGNIEQINKRPVVQRMNDQTSGINWYDAYNKMKNVQLNENVKSNMIWGCLWDETLQWLVDSRSKSYEEINNSVEWGNHSDSSFEYITVDGEIKNITQNVVRYRTISTGSSEQNKANNIYDMAGNAWEWTFERSSSNRRGVRGGGSDNKASEYSIDSRNNSNPNLPYGAGWNIRCTCIFIYKIKLVITTRISIFTIILICDIFLS